MVTGGVDWVSLGFGLGVLAVSVSLHESAHAWTAEQLGDPTGRLQGRVTLNPLAHVDPLGTILFPLITWMVAGLLFGWARPVPLAPDRLRSPRWGGAVVATAGPASNLLLAGSLLVLLRLVVVMSGAVEGRLVELLEIGLVLNVVLGVFNLIPIPPLDGSWILESLLPRSVSGWFAVLRPYGFFLLLGLLYTDLFERLLSPILYLVSWAVYH